MTSEIDPGPRTWDLTVERVFDAPVDLAWKAWSDPEDVKQWWGPIGFTAPVANIDFREGGTSLVCMSSPDIGDFYNTWHYQHIIPLERIEYIVNFADEAGNTLDPDAAGIPPGVPRDVRHVVAFGPIGDTRTRVMVTEYGYTTQEAVAMSRIGLEQCLDKMAALFGPATPGTQET